MPDSNLPACVTSVLFDLTELLVGGDKQAALRLEPVAGSQMAAKP